MLLRPATPLSILFFAAFALLLLSTLSTPVIKAVPLASFDGVSYGVFGYCKGSTCSPVGIGYTTDSNLFSSATNSDFDLPSGARHTLSAILVVHPVAAFMALVCFALAFAAHFHSPSHSPRYLMVLVVLTFPTLLISLLAFLVDILLFVPHMQWGGWIVLAATVIIAVSGVVTCAMRRTLVSRKARKKRIAENAEMNGQNYYANRGGAPTVAMEDSTLPRADSPPPLPTESPGSPYGNGAEFATFDLNKKSMDDRTPLNPRNPSVKSSSTGPDEGPGRFYGEVPPMPPGAAARGRGPPRDQYGNPMPGYGAPLRHQGSNGTMGGSDRSGGPPPFYGGRGRGGYPPRARGGFAPRSRGGPPGMRGPPPPGWNGHGRGMNPGPMAMGMGMGGPMGRGQRGPPPGYNGYYAVPPQGRGREPSPGAFDNRAREVDQQGAMALGVRPEPHSIGEAIEMDGRTGSPQNQGVNNYGLRDSDGDLEGMVGLQQGRFDGGSSQATPHQNTPSPLSPLSDYSQGTDGQAPPRQNWINHQAAAPPLYESDNTIPSAKLRALSPIAASPVSYKEPVELPAGLTKTPTVPANQSPHTGHNRTGSGGGSDNYIEDIDPRFAQSSDQPVSPIDEDDFDVAHPSAAASSAILPSALIPGYSPNVIPDGPRTGSSSPGQVAPLATRGQQHLPHNLPEQPAYYEGNDFEGPRSPGAASDTSHFTSISQRGINPAWHPGPGDRPAYGYAPPRKPRNEDVVLQANPDFSLPGVAAPGRGRNVAGPRSGRRGGPRGANPPAATGMGLANATSGRYPAGGAI